MKIIAYGSLLNRASLEKTLGRSTQLTKIEISGVQRIFNAPFGNYAFLNLETVAGKSIDTAYFTLRPEEAKKFSEREKGSNLIEVLPKYFAFVWPKEDCQDLPVLQSYLDVCEEGCRQLDIDFWRNTIIPRNIIDDTQNPLYP